MLYHVQSLERTAEIILFNNSSMLPLCNSKDSLTAEDTATYPMSSTLHLEQVDHSVEITLHI